MSASIRPLNLYSISPGTPFLNVLADALYDGTLLGRPLGDDPLALARCTILLPTRRACREMQTVLIGRNDGGPLLLPRIRALGDADVADLALDVDSAPDFPDPAHAPAGVQPAMGAVERQLILTELIQAWGDANAARILRLGPGEVPLIPGSPGHAARLANELARLMDSVETEGLDLSAIGGIVPEDHAAYWQITLGFLRIVTENWPAILRERGALPAALRRNLLIDAQAARLGQGSAPGPVIAAGSTGSIPATARLLRVIAGLEQGAVVLPGFDTTLDDDTFALIASGDGTSSHPQHGMARLLREFGLTPNDVRVLGTPAPASAARTGLARLAMAPAALTGIWSAGTVDGTAFAQGLRYLEADSLQHEALLIALIMREALEHKERSVALVTPDRDLARRVQSELKRWNIDLDDSAGTPLAQTEAGLFMRLIANLLVEGLAPVPLLAVLKHPLCRLGLPAAEARQQARLLERLVLRGPRPEPTFDGLRNSLSLSRGTDAEKSDGADLINRLEHAIGGFCTFVKARRVGVAVVAAAHANAAAALARDEEDLSLLHTGADGAKLSQFLDQFAASASQNWRIDALAYPDLFTALLAGHPVRAPHGGDPRLQILGLLEARLTATDCIILGGLNEGTWPAEAARDSWLNRAMRSSIGLPAPERRIGLAAHDFVQAFCASEVILTRARRQNGAQTVASRFLLRLDAALKASGHSAGLEPTRSPYHAAASALLEARHWQPMPAPEPRPPLAARPARLSVTHVETWLRDPYAFYARHVLRLRPLDPLDAALGAADRGTLVHAILGAYMSANPDFSDADKAYRDLIAAGRSHFEAMADAPQVKAFWWRRFERAARWFVDFERDIQPDRVATFGEIKGSMRVNNTLDLEARADRIDLRRDKTLAIYDYKTGRSATAKEILSGLAPQLPLETAIALAGGFAATDARLTGQVSRLAFLRVTGAEPPGEYEPVVVAPPEELAARAVEGLTRLAAAFADPDQAYYSRTRVRMEHEFAGDYDHLARAREWARRLDDKP